MSKERISEEETNKIKDRLTKALLNASMSQRKFAKLADLDSRYLYTATHTLKTLPLQYARDLSDKISSLERGTLGANVNTAKSQSASTTENKSEPAHNHAISESKSEPVSASHAAEIKSATEHDTSLADFNSAPAHTSVAGNKSVQDGNAAVSENNSVKSNIVISESKSASEHTPLAEIKSAPSKQSVSGNNSAISREQFSRLRRKANNNHNDIKDIKKIVNILVNHYEDLKDDNHDIEKAITLLIKNQKIMNKQITDLKEENNKLTGIVAELESEKNVQAGAENTSAKKHKHDAEFKSEKTTFANTESKPDMSNITLADLESAEDQDGFSENNSAKSTQANADSNSAKKAYSHSAGNNSATADAQTKTGNNSAKMKAQTGAEVKSAKIGLLSRIISWLKQ